MKLLLTRVAQHGLLMERHVSGWSATCMIHPGSLLACTCMRAWPNIVCEISIAGLCSHEGQHRSQSSSCAPQLWLVLSGCKPLSAGQCHHVLGCAHSTQYMFYSSASNL